MLCSADDIWLRVALSSGWLATGSPLCYHISCPGQSTQSCRGHSVVLWGSRMRRRCTSSPLLNQLFAYQFANLYGSLSVFSSANWSSSGAVYLLSFHCSVWGFQIGFLWPHLSWIRPYFRHYLEKKQWLPSSKCYTGHAVLDPWYLHLHLLPIFSCWAFARFIHSSWNQNLTLYTSCRVRW